MSDDFFGDLGKNISKYTQRAVTRTGNLVETAKINAQISAEEKEIDKLMRKIGEAVYREKTGKAEMSEKSLEEIIDEINKHKEQAAEYKQNLARVRGMRICTSCGELIPKDVAYCPHCGAPVPVEGEEAASDEENDANTVDGTATTVEEDFREDTAEEEAAPGENAAGEAAEPEAEPAPEQGAKAEEKTEE